MIIKIFSADNLDELEEMTNTYLKFLQKSEYVDSQVLEDSRYYTMAIISTNEPLGYTEELLDKNNNTVKGLSEMFRPSTNHLRTEEDFH